MGLGNPGGEYEGTRHNVGADTVALLARRHQFALRRERLLRSRVASGRVDNHPLTVAIPETYMNDSGLAVAPLVRRFIDGEARHLVVIHDELDLEPGVVRVKAGGGTAGHNGLRSIEAHLHTLGFLRIRIGVGKPRGRSDGAGHVLSRPRGVEHEALAVAVELAADALEKILSDGHEAAMAAFNGR